MHDPDILAPAQYLQSKHTSITFYVKNTIHRISRLEIYSTV